MTVPSVLPSNRTAWELALSETSGARRQLPAHLIKALWNPDTCPADMLGWLASQLSVDIWDERWAETEKRQVCRNAFRLHRLKTTVAGIKEHVALTGATVQRIIRPPARGFLSGPMTAERRAAWLESLPQVRIYPFYHRSTARPGAHFHSGPLARSFHSTRTATASSGGYASPLLFPVRRLLDVERVVTGHLRRSRGAELLGTRATLYDRGSEVDVRYQAEDGTERVYIGSVRKRSWHRAGTFSRHLTSSSAEENVVTLRLGQQFASFAVDRGPDAVEVRPTQVGHGRIAPAARSFYGRFRHGRFLKASHAPFLISEKISLHDAERLGGRLKTRTFHGHGRFGIPAYTAEIRIRVPMTRHVRRSGRWHGAGFRQAADMTALTKAIEAVRVSKAFRDTVLIDTATYGRVQFEGGLRFGEFTFGETKEVR